MAPQDGTRGEALEWLQADPETAPTAPAEPVVRAVQGKPCPNCGWLCEEDEQQCFRCAHPFRTEAPAVPEEPAAAALEPLMETADGPPALDLSQPLVEPALFDLIIRGERLGLSAGFGTLISLDDVAITHYPHQLDAALRVLNTMRGRAILADEVGLGKTVEAGIVLKELAERGLAQQVLIVVPSSLCEQWQEEMAVKFGEQFLIVEGDEAWAQGGRFIVSLDYAKRPEHAEHMTGRDWDLLIVDEAHKLRSRGTQRWKFVNQLRKQYVLLLTATPVSNDLMELYNLVTVLRPGQLGSPRSFRREFVDASDQRRPRNVTQLKRLLGEVMVRNRRATVGIDLPPRRAAVYRLELPPEERRLYDAVTTFIRDQLRANPEAGELRLWLLTLQRELCSSPRALLGTLQRMAADQQTHPAEVRQELARLADAAAGVTVARKAQALLELLGQIPDQMLVFTSFVGTMEEIAGHLRAREVPCGTFHGGLASEQKEAAVAAFRHGETRVLVSTEAGGEGRNLQFCHVLVNYDLPWNPMRIEQRIGRLHRLGQTEPVTVVNLAARRTIEEYILDLLAHKIRMFELVIGEVDLILGTLKGERSFEQMVADVWAASQTEEELRGRLDGVGGELEAARQAYQQVREAGNLLSQALEQ